VDYLPQRKLMMQEWAAYLDRLRTSRVTSVFVSEQLSLQQRVAGETSPVDEECQLSVHRARGLNLLCGRGGGVLASRGDLRVPGLSLRIKRDVGLDGFD
jgi:hypothetical protein